MVRRLRSEDGFTLIELLSAQVIGLIVLSMVGMLVLVSLKMSNVVADSTNSANVGRNVLQDVSRQLASQTCLFPGEYTLNGATTTTSSSSNILHADSNRIIFIGDSGNVSGAAGVTGSIGFLPKIRWLQVTAGVSGSIGATGNAQFVDGYLNPTNSTRPFNFPVTGMTSLDGLATNAGADSVTPTYQGAIADGLQYVTPATVQTGGQMMGTGHFYYYDDSGDQVAETNGAVDAADLPSITRVHFEFRVKPQSNQGTANNKVSEFSDDFYVHAIADRCSG